MDKVAQLPASDRNDLFRAAATEMGVAPAIIEKDFWVCWTLRRLYTLPTLETALHFKGGTSLSKVYGAIHRMSEDIDLVIDRTDLGFTGERDPTQDGLSNNGRKRLILQLRAEASVFVRDLCTSLREHFGAHLNDELWTLESDPDDADDATLLFSYPVESVTSEYVRPVVRLEFGARSDPSPSEAGSVQPYAAEYLPGLFEDADTAVPSVVAAERTFWEKATTLHKLYHKPAEQPLGSRLSRHYSDLFHLSNHPCADHACSDLNLLDQVVAHNQLFFRRSWTNFETAVAGTLRLVPPEHRMEELRDDYDQMAEMMFGTVTPFEEVIGGLSTLEQRINGR